MKKLFKTFAVLVLSGTMAFASINPQSFKVSMYNVQNTHKLKVFVDKQNSEALAFEVLDKNGNVLQKELIGKNKSMAGVSLDLSNLESGEYTIQISDKGSVYSKTVQVQKEQKEELKIVI